MIGYGAIVAKFTDKKGSKGVISDIFMGQRF